MIWSEHGLWVIEKTLWLGSLRRRGILYRLTLAWPRSWFHFVSVGANLRAEHPGMLLGNIEVFGFGFEIIVDWS